MELRGGGFSVLRKAAQSHRLVFPSGTQGELEYYFLISFPGVNPKSWFQNMLALVLLDTTALEVQPCLSPAHLVPLDLGLSLAQR